MIVLNRSSLMRVFKINIYFAFMNVKIINIRRQTVKYGFTQLYSEKSTVQGMLIPGHVYAKRRMK